MVGEWLPPQRTIQPGFGTCRRASGSLAETAIGFWRLPHFERMGGTKVLVELLGRDKQSGSELLGISFRKMV